MANSSTSTRVGSLVEGEETYLIWSNEHNAWWGPNRCGYAPGLIGAGKYSREAALAICRDAIPTSAGLRRISEIPVRFADVSEFTKGAMLPAVIMQGDR